MSLPRFPSRSAAAFLLHYVERRPISHFVVFATVLAAVGCAIGSQYGVKNLVDVLASTHPADYALWRAVVLLLALVAGDNLLWRLAGWVATYAFVAVGGDLRLDLFEHLSGHSARYFTEHFPGALTGRITTAANAAWSIENALMWTTIPPAVAVVSSIAVLSIINWHITALLAVTVAILGAIIARRAAHGRPLHTEFANEAAKVTGDLSDVVSNIGIVRAFGAAWRERTRLQNRIAREMAAQRASLRSLECLRTFHAVLVFLVTAGVLIWAIALWRDGSITTGDVVLTTSLGFTVLHASRDLALALVEVVQHFAKLDEAVKVLGLPHEIEDTPDAPGLINLGGSISFESISFNYPDGQRVLEDFKLHVPAGTKLGLVGRSGAGKTTILALLQRLYEPSAGRVLIDEQDIAKVKKQSLNQMIAVVQQDVSLFHRSVLENLCYGRPDATPEEIYHAAEVAGCSEFIRRLPQCFETIVGERGVKLSGGQRQRLAIARAFLRNAPIILLDEATSALDSESERFVQAALLRLIKGRTVIAIAHRLSTLSAFDRIVELDGGRIVSDCTAAEYLQRNGPALRLVGRKLSVGGKA